MEKNFCVRDEALLTHVKIKRFKKQVFLTAAAIGVISLHGFAIDKIETIGQTMRQQRQTFIGCHGDDLVPEIFIIQALQILIVSVALVYLLAVGCVFQFFMNESIVSN